MVNFFKKYWWIIIIAVIVIAYFIIRRYKQSVTLEFSLEENAQNILNNLLGSKLDIGAGFYVDIPLTTTLKNNNAASIILSNISGALSYNGKSILQTNANSPVLKEVSIAGKSAASITDNMQLLVNTNTIDFFKNLVQGNKPSVKYNFSTVIFGKPQTLTNITQIDTKENADTKRIASGALVSSPSAVSTNTCQKGDYNCIYRGISVPCRECTKRGITIAG